MVRNFVTFSLLDLTLILVDRILRQRKLEKQAEDARMREENIKLISQTPQAVDKTTLSSPDPSTLVPDAHEPLDRSSSFSDAIQKWKRRVGVSGGPGFRGQSLGNGHKPEQLPALGMSNSVLEPQIPGGMPGGLWGEPLPQPSNGTGNPSVTPLSNICEICSMLNVTKLTLSSF